MTVITRTSVGIMILRRCSRVVECVCVCVSMCCEALSYGCVETYEYSCVRTSMLNIYI